jgi:hypothetical protein
MTTCNAAAHGNEGLLCHLVRAHSGPHRNGTSYWFSDWYVDMQVILEDCDFTFDESMVPTPAQLLGRLLTMRPEDRTRALEMIIQNGETASKCFKEGHDTLMEQHRMRKCL